MPTRILLVRHALCDSVGRRLAGREPGVDLNEAGLRQARALAGILSSEELAAVYCGPLERTFPTAAAIAEAHELQPVPDDAFDEVDVGAWTGAPFDQLAADPAWRAFNELRSTTRPPGGELLIEAQARAVAGLEVVRRLHDGASVVIVTHADIVRAVTCHLLGMPVDHLLRIEIAPAATTTFEFHGQRPLLVGLNAVP
jgi:broad specificity phosphatase PhoE